MCAFSTSLTTTVFSQRSRWRFEASPRRAAPKGQLLHLSHSIASRSFAYIDGSFPRSWRTGFRSSWSHVRVNLGVELRECVKGRSGSCAYAAAAVRAVGQVGSKADTGGGGSMESAW